MAKSHFDKCNTTRPKKRICCVALFRPTQNLAKVGLGFFFFFFNIQTSIFTVNFVTKLAIFSTGSFSLAVRIVLNSSVFGFTARKVLWQSGCHHLLCIFCVRGLWLWLEVHVYMFKKKKKRFSTDGPNLKFLSPKGQHNNFFYLAQW